MAATVGLVGRYVSVDVTRGDKTEREVCEVVACQCGGEYGYWRILVVTHDGSLLSYDGTSKVTLVPVPSTIDGPYR